MTTGESAAPVAALRRREWGVIPWLGIALPRRRSLAVWRRNRDVFFQLWRTELVPPLLEPIIMFFALGLGLGTYVRLTGDVEYIAFLGPGVLASVPMLAAIFESVWGAYFRLDRHGTYEAILATPTRPEEVIAGEILWAATRGALNATMIFVVMLAMTPAYGLVRSPLAVLTIPATFGMGMLFAGMGLSYISRARSVSQLNYFFSLVIFPMFWFSGGFFPLDGLPGWAGTAAWFTPLFHAVELNRDLLTGDAGWATLGHAAWLAVVAVPSCWAGLWFLRRRLVH